MAEREYPKIYQLHGLTVREEENYAEVFLTEDYGSKVLSVRKANKDWGGRAETSTINWSAWGSQSPEVTMQVAHALQVGVILAMRFDTEFTEREVKNGADAN